MIERSDIFYRDSIAGSSPPLSPLVPKPTKLKPTGILGPLGPLLGSGGDDETPSTEPPKHEPTGLLGPLLGDILERSVPNALMQAPQPMPTFMDSVFNSTQIIIASTVTTTVLSTAAAATVTSARSITTVTAMSYAVAQGAVSNFQTSARQEPVPFTGIFFR